MHICVQVRAWFFWFVRGALFRASMLKKAADRETADAQEYGSQVATVTVRRAIAKYDDARRKWFVIGRDVIVGSGFALDWLGSCRIVTAGHNVQEIHPDDGAYCTTLEALVTPASEFRTVPREDRVLWDTAVRLGGIRVNGYKTLFEPAVRQALQQQSIGIRPLGEQPTGCDVAVLLLDEPFLPQGEETLRVETHAVNAGPDPEGRAGLFLGCAGERPWAPDQLIRWPTYSVLSCPDPGRALGFPAEDAFLPQFHDGLAWKGMSGGPVIVHDAFLGGMSLSLHPGSFVSPLRFSVMTA